MPTVQQVYVNQGDGMPYQTLSDLPDSVRNNLPTHAQEIYRAAFNHAWDEYAARAADGREETAHKVAWSAVKKRYRKDEKSGKWLSSGAEF